MEQAEGKSAEEAGASARRPQRHGALIAALLVIMAPWAGPALAQNGAAETCTGLPDSAAEIACLRAALAARTRGDAKPEPARPAPPRTVTPVVRATPQPAQREAPTALAAPRSTTPELGADQLPGAGQRARHADDARILAAVTGVATDRDGLLLLTLDNGQIWQQVERPTIPLALAENRQSAVEIARSGFGGYRMRFTEQGRTIVVRRRQ